MTKKKRALTKKQIDVQKMRNVLNVAPYEEKIHEMQTHFSISLQSNKARNKSLAQENGPLKAVEFHIK